MKTLKSGRTSNRLSTHNTIGYTFTKKETSSYFLAIKNQTLETKKQGQKSRNIHRYTNQTKNSKANQTKEKKVIFSAMKIQA